LGTDSNILTCLATCFPDFFVTSAYDEPLQSVFSGALSKIHCSSLLSKLHSSCIFKAGYSTLSLYFGARFGADSNILTCLATCFSDFFATSAYDEPLRSIFSGALSKTHCSSCLAKCILAASLKQVTLHCRLLRCLFWADSNILTCLVTCLADFVATSACDEHLQSIFSGALSKIHC
jgi:hypothetical protein